jgi:manganese/zinc/iron transport system substrate-binding protein
VTFTRRHFLGTLAAAPLLAAPARAAAPLSITATTGMVADIARNIGGDLAEVTALMGPGIDPHGYRQTRSDIVAMTSADLVLWNGHYLEAQLEDFLLTLGERAPVTAVAEAVPEGELLRHEDYAGRADPHVWMVPRLWHHAVHATRDAMTELRPDAADSFAANAEAYLADLDAIGAYAADVLGTVPEEARVLISAHDAFGYFGAEYGYEVMGIQGISTESEAGLQRIAELVDLLVSRRIGAVFVESTISERNVRALVEGAAAEGHEVAIGGELFADAMGAPGTYEGTYIGMIDHNATTLARALGGTAPAAGLNGKLSAGT